MLAFAAFTPHPPIIIPEIGDKNIQYCQKTAESMKTLAKSIEERDIDTVIFISPHTTYSPNNMIVSYNEHASGSFASFGHPEISYRSSIDLDLAAEIIRRGKKNKLPIQPLSHDQDYEFDHGAMVPYYYLKPELNSTVEVIIIGFSAESRSDHFSFGQTIMETIQASDKNVAIIASGDLSHKNFDIGAEMIGKKFDAAIVDSTEKFDPGAILNIDPDLQEEAGECGYRSLLILLGILDGLDIESRVLSYEAPFGVGYMVAEFTLKG